MWLTVYVPFATGLILTLSRGSMGGGNSQCDWDNFFASMMQASDERGKELGFATFGQTLGSKTVGGFVPNGANAAEKSYDRTEPIVGAKVLRAMVKRFGVDETAWLIAWSFDQLYGWHDWAWNNRQLVHSHGLIAPGSSPMPPGTGVPDCDRSGTGLADSLMQCARWETGMDNSPMYDGPDVKSDNKSGPIFFNATNHLMEVMDVGMTGNLASDMGALAELGDLWCNSTNASIAGTCGSVTKKKIGVTKARLGLLVSRMQQHLSGMSRWGHS